MKDINRIPGAEQLVAIFGYWPSFHDAEVLWLQLDRQSLKKGRYGPTLEILVHTFEITNEIGADSSYLLRHHVLVHFRFNDVASLQLDGFNPQDPIMGLILIDLQDRQMERVKWNVRFDEVSFQCFGIEVVSVLPCDRNGNQT